MSRVARYTPILVFMVLVSLFFYKLAFTDMILARGDTFSYFYPYWDIRNAYFQHLQFPLWTPNLFMGSPLLAEPQLGTFYIPNWLTTPFTAPDAVRYSILGHIFWAGCGVYVLFNTFLPKRGLNVAAVISAILFAFGGFIAAHVEQINQLQGLAWMPWIFWLYYKTLQPDVSQNRLFQRAWWGMWLAMAIALQFFSGHTQTVFITGVGLGIFTVVTPLAIPYSARTPHPSRETSEPITPVTPASLPARIIYHLRSIQNGAMPALKRMALGIVILITVALITLLLVMPQFLPTLELTGMSNRGGSGFTAPQSTAFSLPPQYLGRSLLPTYDGLLFGEYIGTLGVIGLGLGLLAVLYPRVDSPLARWRWVWFALALIGLLLAFGRYNPIYYNVLAEMRGFNLFRVPARWLALFSLGTAMLGGMGMHFLLEHRQFRKRALIPMGLLVALMLMARLMPVITPALAILPEDFTGSALPTTKTLLLWGVALGAFGAMAFVRLPKWLMVLTVVVEMWGASQMMPYNNLAPRDVYLGKRFTVSQMQAYAQDSLPMGRVLSMSQLLFDVGDKDALRARYERMGMNEESIQIAFTAIKRQEMLVSNLPMTWDIPSVDGYGGGILPTIYYTQFTALIMPDGTRTVDGRLGEALSRPDCRGACVPKAQWLALMNVRYLITDKVYDIWQDGVAFDTTFQRHVVDTQWRVNSPFRADQVQVVYTGDDVRVEGATLLNSTALVDGLTLSTFAFDALQPIDTLRVTATADTRVQAVSVRDSHSDLFVQTTPADWQRVLSSDVKIYHSEAGARAYLTTHVSVFTDSWQGSEDALAALQTDPDTTMIQGDVAPLNTASDLPTPQFITYSPERVIIHATSPQEAYLILSDAWYPHWKATVNGVETPIYRANVMFRAVKIPAGESDIIFTFEPDTWWLAIGFGAVMWVLLAIVGVWLWRKKRVQG